MSRKSNSIKKGAKKEQKEQFNKKGAKKEQQDQINIYIYIFPQKYLPR